MFDKAADCFRSALRSVEYLYNIKPVYVYEIIGNYYDVKSLHSIQKIEAKLYSII